MEHAVFINTDQISFLNEENIDSCWPGIVSFELYHGTIRMIATTTEQSFKLNSKFYNYPYLWHLKIRLIA